METPATLRSVTGSKIRVDVCCIGRIEVDVHSLPLIDRYLARRIAVPLVGTLLLSFMVLVIEELARLMSVVVNTGAPVRLIWRMLAYLLPEYLGLAIPIALLLGILLAFRSLAQSAELDVLRGIGLGFGRLLYVPYVYAVAMMALTFLTVGFVEPIASYHFERLGFELDTGAIGASFKVGEFNRFGRNAVLRIERSEQKGSRLLGVFLTMENGSGGSIAVTAESGRFLKSESSRAIMLRLRKGRLVQSSPNLPGPRTLSFASYDVPLDIPAIRNFRDRGAEDSELTLTELVARSGGPRVFLAARRRASADFNARLAEVAFMAMLPLLAVSLAIPPKRGTPSLGAVVGILILVAFEKLMQHAAEIGAAGTLDPFLAVWTPFALLSLMIWRMYWIVSRRPGGQPIDAIQRIASWGEQLARRHLAR